jgi:hypothetical protein
MRASRTMLQVACSTFLGSRLKGEITSEYTSRCKSPLIVATSLRLPEPPPPPEVQVSLVMKFKENRSSSCICWINGDPVSLQPMQMVGYWHWWYGTDLTAIDLYSCQGH